MRNNCTSRTTRVFSIASEVELASKAGTNQLTRCSHPSSSHSGSYIAIYITFRASLSGTFLQTLPELVTSLKGRALFISARVMSTDVAHDHGARPAVVKKKKKKRRVPSGFKRFWFYLCWHKKAMWMVIKETPDIIWIVCHNWTTVSWLFSAAYDVTSCGSGWRKEVITSAWSLHSHLSSGTSLPKDAERYWCAISFSCLAVVPLFVCVS